METDGFWRAVNMISASTIGFVYSLALVKPISGKRGNWEGEIMFFLSLWLGCRSLIVSLVVSTDRLPEIPRSALRLVCLPRGYIGIDQFLLMW
jgi:hypothetical protein